MHTMIQCIVDLNTLLSVVIMVVRKVECVGPVFLSQLHLTPLVLDDRKHKPNKSANEVSASSIDYEEPLYKNLNEKSLKEQDHYAILRLSHLRHKATEEDIKKAYHNQVLRHHPDKRKTKGTVQGQSEGEYFTRITKAWEILGNPKPRRAYDSIDPCFDNSIPSLNEYNRKNFYSVFGRVFESNSRWSEKMPVPQLGDESTTKDDVLHFYSFWNNFISWREFSYLDNEEAINDSCKETRKYLQKENKQTRAKRKREEMARICKLVDTAYALDPRISQYKKEEQEAKEAIKLAKKNMAKMKREEEERKIKAAEEALRLEKEREEEEEKARQNAMKAERAANKQALKKSRTTLRKFVKENNYFCENSEELVKHMTDTEKLCENLNANELNRLVSSIIEGGRKVFLNAVEQLGKNIDNEVQKTMTTAYSATCLDNAKDVTNALKWTTEEIQLLQKAMIAFPAGANNRWESVSHYINQHYRINEYAQRTPKEVLLKAKELQSNVYCRNITSSGDFQNLNNNNVRNKQTDAQTSSLDMLVDQKNIKSSWTATDQKLLEKALIMFPASTPERWDKIAAHVPNKTKRECMKRYKEIAEMLKIKKNSQNN